MSLENKFNNRFDCKFGTTNLRIHADGLHRPNIGKFSCTFGYVVDGTGYYVREDGKRYYFSPGTVFFKPSTYRFDHLHEPIVFINKYFVIDEYFYKYIISNVKSDEGIVHISHYPHASIAAGFDELFKELLRQKPSRFFYSWSKVLPFIMGLCQEKEILDLFHEESLNQALDLLESPQNIQIGDIARRVHMSESNFRRIFQKRYELTPVEYRIQHRLGEIRHRLETENILLKDLAIEYGYTDAYALSHQFKKFFGYAPKSNY